MEITNETAEKIKKHLVALNYITAVSNAVRKEYRTEVMDEIKSLINELEEGLKKKKE